MADEETRATPERPAAHLGPAAKEAREVLLSEIAGSEAWDAGRPPGVKVRAGDMVAAARGLVGLGWRLDSYTAVDRIERVELVAHVVGPGSELLSLRCEVPGGEGDSPSMETLTGVWPSANWLEREIYDLFGVTFVGHPDLRRVALTDEFVGHPLRKSFPLDVVEEAGGAGAGETEKAGEECQQ